MDNALKKISRWRERPAREHKDYQNKHWNGHERDARTSNQEVKNNKIQYGYKHCSDFFSINYYLSSQLPENLILG